MSNFNTFRPEEESPSSDEKMDTGSDTFRSQDTPNSTQSSDSDDADVLRLRNPQVLRLAEQNDSLTSKMSNLNLDSPETRAKNFGISPPKFSSMLTLTTSHPLMGLGSPEDFPDLIPKKHKAEDEKDLSLSSIEDDRNDTNLYSPQRNTSKNNLYISENFVTADSHILSESLSLPPDVARVKVQRRKIIPTMEAKETPSRTLARTFEGAKIDCAEKMSHSTPKWSNAVDITQDEFHSGTAEWCESPSQLRAMPNFELPIEMSTAVGLHNANELESPDVVSSAAEERSAYEALLDPYTGSVALRHTAPRSPALALTRRKIQLPVEEDRCSLDGLSDASLESEDEPVQMSRDTQCDMPCDVQPCDAALCDNQHAICSDDEDTKRSKSTNTVSYSDTIPEYSAAEELSNERAWLSVRDGERRVCDMKVIEPYKRVLSHGGYTGGQALVVFSACHLPDNSRRDYTYVMDNLFLYVIWTLERLVTEEYILVYLHGSAGRRRLPSFHWLHECYKLIDRRLRKSLKHLYLVHPTFWLKSFVILTKPFISSKFFKKLSYVRSLDELMEKVPVEPNAIPEIVKQYDAARKR